MTTSCGVLAGQIEKILDYHRWSALELERRAGISRGRVDSIRRGRTPGVDAIEAIARAAGVNLKWLVTGEGEMFETPVGTCEVPVIATAGAIGGERVAYAAEGREEGRLKLPSDAHLVRVTGDSMVPVVCHGQHVWVSNEPPRDGDLAVIEREDGEVLFKRVSFIGGQIVATPVNQDPHYKPEVLDRRSVRRMKRVLGAWY